jgi:demethylmenaquinone methyltransferase/2-methoxy-6-polyprenyl-1,4-benzoquinol methylase
MSNIDDQVNFGFSKIDINKKTDLVKSIFSSVAGKYDLMNDLMSFGWHRLWKIQLMKYLPNKAKSLIDVAGGTGDITINYCKAALRDNIIPKVTLCDINHEMLTKGENKLIDLNLIKYVQIQECNAEAMPFPDNSFDYYTIVFGIRNITHIDLALKEAHRILKPGGKFVCMEFSQVSNKILEKIYDTYSMTIIPKIGKLFASNQEAYQYLVESIRNFPCQKDFSALIQQAGFKFVNYNNLFNGITAIHFGYKI